MSEAMVRDGRTLRAAADAGWVAIGGLRVRYRRLAHSASTAAATLPVVLIHGAACDMSFWDLQLPALAGLGTLLLVDLPGHGESQWVPGRRYSMRLYADAVCAAMDAAGVDRAAIIGHSMGVNVAREVYRAVPGRVAALVAISGILVYEPPGRVFSLVRRLTTTRAGRLLWGPWVRRLVGPDTPAWARSKVLSSMLSAPPLLVRSYLHEMLHPDTAYNDAIHVPVLSLLAESHRGSAASRRALATLNTCSEVVVLPHASHFLQLDAAGETNRLIEAFLRRRAAA